MNLRHWLWQLLVALDQLVNVLITPGQAGAWADETLSSRAWRMEQAGKPWGRVFRPLVDALFWWEPGHCQASFAAEREQRQLPPEARRQEPPQRSGG